MHMPLRRFRGTIGTVSTPHSAPHTNTHRRMDKQTTDIHEHAATQIHGKCAYHGVGFGCANESGAAAKGARGPRYHAAHRVGRHHRDTHKAGSPSAQSLCCHTRPRESRVEATGTDDVVRVGTAALPAVEEQGDISQVMKTSGYKAGHREKG